MLKMADLANRPDFTAGSLRISPSRRRVEGPSGSAQLEPIVMKVFLLLLDAAGSVVTRDELFGIAWGGVYVGDDSLNRAIARVRKVSGDTAPGLFEIETVPRTGYRLAGPIVEQLDDGEHTAAPQSRPAWTSRRTVIAAGTAAVAAVAAGGLWSVRRSSRASAESLVEQARSSFYRGDDEASSVAPVLERALTIEPHNADARGLLALVQSTSPVGAAGFQPRAASKVRANARLALSLNADQSNALLALYELESATLDWFARDQRLRSIIGKDVKQIPAISELVALLQSAGLNRESRDWNERAIAIEPLSRELQSRRAMKLWIAGRTEEADKVIDQARDLWPESPFVWWVRFLILATTGRAGAAQAMLETDTKRQLPPWTALWRACLPALIQPDAANVSKARTTCLRAAQTAAVLAVQAVMILGTLNQTDAAFDICDGFLLWKGSVVRTGDNRVRQLGTDSAWRISLQWLFTPPCAAMRGDGRFLPLCKDVGLIDYWSRRGVRPDYMRS
jgi:DNA-binding winged helix-turn-helix (wHTH) protein